MKIDDLLRTNASELVAAYTEPTPAAVASAGQQQPTRLRIGVAVAAAVAVILLAAPIALLRSGNGENSGQFGSQTPTAPLETTTLPPTTVSDTAAPTTTVEPHPEDDGLYPPTDENGISMEDVRATPAQILRERSLGDITFRLSERPSEYGRCLEVTAMIDNVVHSVGGTCSLFRGPSSQAWSLERPIRFVIEEKSFVAFFGRAGSEVATVRVSGPVNVVDTQVTGTWLAVAEVVGDLSEIVVESFASDESLLLSERVPMEPTRGASQLEVAAILDVEGLITELRIAAAVVSRFPIDAPIGSPFFRGEATQLCVDGIPLTVFEYHEASARAFDSRSITPDGRLETPGTMTIIEWIGQPRLFGAGRIVVLHLNSDPATLDLLTSILGPTLSPDGVGQRGDGYPPCDN